MKKVVFLDFDGVLNTENYQSTLFAEGKPTVDTFGPLFDPKAVENLKKVLDAVPEALIVIISSWKLYGLEMMEELWMTRGLPGKLHGITPDYVPDLLNINLETIDDPALLAGKGNEIRCWIETNAPEGCNYVIFDDVPDFLPGQKENHIRTDPRTGITEEEAEKAILLLNSNSRS